MKRTLLATAIFTALLAHSSAFAQTDQDADQLAVDSEGMVEEVIVTGVRQSLDSAAEIKRSSDQLVDAISAEDIGMFSDNNIAEALQRVPGVQVERDMGEGFRISIRGLGPRFVRTTVNGRTALSTAGGEDGSGEDARGFTLNMMPSEVISRVTVEKSTQAKNLEGGLGGTLDMQTVRPVDFAERRDKDWYISGAGRIGYNDLVDDLASRLSLFANKKFGDNFGLYFGMVLDDTDQTDYAVESEAYRVRYPWASNSNVLNYDRLEPGTLFNGQALTQDDIDALHESTLGVGPDGEDAGTSLHNAARNTARDLDRARQTYTTGMQWKKGDWDVNFDWTYGHEENNQYLRRWVMSAPNLARSREQEITSLDVDFTDQNFNRSTPTMGTLTRFEMENTRGSSRVSTENRYIPREQDINVGGINVNWSGDLWNINGDVGYAKQHTKRYDQQVGTDLASDYRNRNNADPRMQFLNAWWDTTGPGGVTTAGLTGVDEDGNLTPFDATDPSLYRFRRAWFTLTEELTDDTSARIDFTRELPGREEGDLWSIFEGVMFGVAWNERDGNREKARYREDETASNGHDILDIDRYDIISGYELQGINNYRNDIPGVTHDFIFLSNRDPVFDPLWALADDELETIHNNEYEIVEEITSFYIQLPFGGLSYRGNIGARWVNTDQTAIGWVGGSEISEDGLSLSDEYVIQTTKKDYDDLLPSFNIAFDLSDTWVLRLAANKSMTRPDPLDLAAWLNLGEFYDEEEDGGQPTGSSGNPDLEPYYADNYDMSLEWYPESGGAYAFGLFYKDIEGWIARGRQDEWHTAPYGVDGDGSGSFDPDEITDGVPGNGGDYYEMRESLYSIRKMVNTDGGTIKGAEFSFHQPFDAWTEGFWSYFGINGSLTYVDAEMDAVVPENQLPISLRGTSEWSGNLVAYFERKKFSARLAMNYRDDFLFQEAEDPYRHDEWTEGSTIVDLNMDYRFNRSWVLRFSANNLTGENRLRYWNAPTQPFSDDRDNGQYYTLELRYRTR
ncbi:MAG: TonB-dependent receptor [Xanthomonadales bacterium]|nr:TonB-dependent receptor [Xanthomonadales bacterium]